METGDLQTQTFRIDGMTCINCQNRIEKKLKHTKGVLEASVSYEASKATVKYNASAITFSEIKDAVESLGYKIADKKETNKIIQIVGTLVIILALYMLLRMFSTSDLAAAFPVARTGMSYGMVLLIGLVTSVHCVAMCGGINLSQTLGSGEWGVGSRGSNLKYNDASEAHRDSSNNDPRSLLPRRTQPPKGGLPTFDTADSSSAGTGRIYSSTPFNRALYLFPAILYNSGRLISYTAVGVIVGALGSVITLSGRFQGTVYLLAGIFMLIMGINMLGLFPVLRRFTPRMPAKLHKKLASIFAKKTPTPHSPLPTPYSPLIIGFLNGFIPCGPLQAMQLYALSTGSPVLGGISMFLFCLGTIPLMFALGAAGSILSGAKGRAFSRRVMQVGAILVAAMGLTMFTNGWSLAGINSPANRVTAIARPASTTTESRASSPMIQDGVQIINSTLLPNRYPAIVVQQGIPVRWIINAPQGSITGCNNRFIIREYGIEYTFRLGYNIIEFMPERTGQFIYSCWMGMIRSTITVQ
ncbi:MAG: sulfite exporter TauE/SafE family protein [Treponema sp.]|jgi:sulfite exporter TauE/SafE/copper chaperone CopZ|nr:sulfite exporter TauE/SafE family protein [Treponema sp.]